MPRLFRPSPPRELYGADAEIPGLVGMHTEYSSFFHGTLVVIFSPVSLLRRGFVVGHPARAEFRCTEKELSPADSRAERSAGASRSLWVVLRLSYVSHWRRL